MEAPDQTSPGPSRRTLIGLGAALGVNVAGFATWRLLRDEDGLGDSDLELASVPSGKVGLPEVGGGMRAVDVPISAPAGRGQGGRGIITPEMPSDDFRMLGVTWRGPEELRIDVRTRVKGAGWSDWQSLRMLHDRPDPDSGEGDPELRATEPFWADRASGVQLRVRGASPRRLDLALVDPGVLAGDQDDGTSARTGAAADRRGMLPRGPADKHAPRPVIRTRYGWGANESWRGESPSYVRQLHQVHVHHTVSSNSYGRADVPAMIRSMYWYHTQRLGWSDIGYNFLVDKWGRAWEGRAGGVLRNVRGAHTLGFNHMSVGIAAIGNFESARPTVKLLQGIVFLAAWKLDRAGRPPLGHVKIRSEGSDRFRDGQLVRLPRIDGHRDTNETACPGRHLYESLLRIRRWAHRRARYFG